MIFQIGSFQIGSSQIAVEDPPPDAGPRRSLSRRGVLQGLAGAAGLATGIGVAPSHPLAATAEPIKIGVSCSLTGQYAQLGQWTRNGVMLAANAVNRNGGIKGRPVQVVFADDQGTNPTAASNAVTKLLAQEHVVALLGPHFTPAILPNLPLLEQFQVPALTGASGPAVTKQNSPWVFRVRLNDQLGAALLVAFVTDGLGWKKIGLAYVNTAFGQSGIASVKQALAARNIVPVAVRSHSDATRDFTAPVLTFSDAGVDGVIAWTDDQPAGLLIKQMRIMGARFGFAGSTSISQPMFLQLAGDAAEGAYSVTDFTKNNTKPAIVAWRREYQSVFHSAPELYATCYHDAFNLVALALGRASSVSGPAVRQALTELHDIREVMTTYSWSPGGDMVHSGLITKIENGTPEIVKTIGA